MGLRKHTQFLRRTVTQTGRQIEGGPSVIILGPEAGGSGTRRVTLNIPESPTVYMAIGPMDTLLHDGTALDGVDNAGARPEDIANSRNYQWASADGGQPVVFEILPDQWIAAMSEEGIAELTLLVEYLT